MEKSGEVSDSLGTLCFTDTIDNLSMLQDSSLSVSTPAFPTSSNQSGKMAHSSASLTSLSIGNFTSNPDPLSGPCQTSTTTDILTSAATSIFGPQHAKMSHNPNSNLNSQYVIVEEPIDNLHSLNDFSNVNIGSCSNLALADDVAAGTSMLNTPQAMTTDDPDKDSNQFSSMDLLVADDDISNSASSTVPTQDSSSQQTANTANDALDSFVFPGDISENKDDTSFPTNYVYQYDSIASEKESDPQSHDALIDHCDAEAERNKLKRVNAIEGKGIEETDHDQFETERDASETTTIQDKEINDVSELLIQSAEVNQPLETNEQDVATDKTDQERNKTDSDLSFLDDNDSLDRLEQEKTMFSENLGLIPADTERKIKADRDKAAKGVRTRRSYEVSKSQWGSAISGHTHIRGSYKCGTCNSAFELICALHDHLQDHCLGGSYHYDHLLRTAYPKYDTTCSYAQTMRGDFVDEVSDSEIELVPTKKVKVTANTKTKVKAAKTKVKPAKRKAKTIKAVTTRKSKAKLVQDNERYSKVGKRKRGRPKRYIDDDPVEEDKIDEIVDEPNEIVIETVIDPEPEDILIAESDHDDDIKDPDFNASEYEEPDILTYIEAPTEIEKIIPEPTSDTKDAKEVPKAAAKKRKMTTPRRCLKLQDVEQKRKRINKNEKKISCEFCPSIFQYTQRLIKHEQEKHADKMTLECDECDQKFMRDYNLERHKLIAHSGDKTSQSNDRKGIYRGKRRVKRKPAEKGSKVMEACLICKKEMSAERMEVHMRLHTGERPFICHICGKGLISEKKIKRHLLIHSDESRHTCDVCGEGFSMKAKLRTHMYTHTGHKPYLCSVCGADFNNSTSLLHHNRTLHLGDKRFECQICGGKYGKKSQLEEHMASHSNERAHTCRYCGKSFKHAKSLRRHEATHGTEIKFACDQCDSKFSRKDNLDRHKMCHVNTTLQCRECKKKFKDERLLQEHEQNHVKARRFLCQICKEKFLDETFFYNHMERNHGISKEMVPMINSLAEESNDKPVKPKRPTEILNPTIIIENVKPLPAITQSIPSSHSIPSSLATTTIDTLNLSMSVAGIIPSSGQELQTINLQGLQTVFNSQANAILSPTIPNYSNQGISVGRSLVNSNFSDTPTSVIVQSIPDVQRLVVNPSDQSARGNAVSVSLVPAENFIFNEQQRLMQETIGNTVPGTGFRIEQMF